MMTEQDKTETVDLATCDVAHFDHLDTPNDGRDYWACPGCEQMMVEEAFHIEEGKCWDCHRKAFNGFMGEIISNFEEDTNNDN